MTQSDEIRATLQARIATIEKTSASQNNTGSALSSNNCDIGASFEKADEEDLAFQKILRLVKAREVARKTLYQRLIRDGFSEDVVLSALDRATRTGLVDDGRFAEALLHSRLVQRRGIQGIMAELKNLDIDISLVSGWPEEFSLDDESETERAVSLLRKKPPQARNQRAAAYRRLKQKGFASAIAMRAARIWAESCGGK